jgi:hypothetical protein
LYCVPDSKITLQHVSSVRMRLLGFVSRLPVSQEFIGRWAGTRFTMSQVFQASSLNKGAAPNDGPAAQPDNSDTSGGGRHR